MRTVILLCEHQVAGSFGLVLNKLSAKTLDQLMAGFDGFPIQVFYGGPVQKDTVHFLHQCPDKVSGGIEVGPGIYWGGDFEKLAKLVRSGQIDMAKLRFFIGYSGWSDGQLGNEIAEKTWLTVAATEALVFHALPAEIWKDSIKALGGEYEIMVNYPTDPQLN